MGGETGIKSIVVVLFIFLQFVHISSCDNARGESNNSDPHNGWQHSNGAAYICYQVYITVSHSGKAYGCPIYGVKESIIGIAKELHRGKMLTDAQLSLILSDLQSQDTFTPGGRFEQAG